MLQWKRLAALLLAGTMGISVFTACGSDDSDTEESFQETTESAIETTESETTVSETTIEETTMTTTVHVSPTEMVSSTLGTEISDINAYLNRDGTNTYNAKLTDFSLEEGDVIQSFTFIVYSDSDYILGDYKGGYGISVDDSCAMATDEGWYEADDFTQYLNSTYAEFTWNIPSGITDSIDISSGEVMFGHWWSNVQSVRLSSIVCTFTRTREVPVDGTNTVSSGQNLNYNSSQKGMIPLSSLIGEEDTLQTVTFDISSGGSLGKFTGAFGVSVKDGAACATEDGWYQTQNICVFTDSSSLNLTWIVPDDVRESIDPSGNILLGFWWSDQSNITINSVSVRYSNATGTTTVIEAAVAETESADTAEENASVAESTSSSEVDSMTSAEIIADIRVGWNLGNTLDSYNTGSSDTETGWGNPKTTKAMFEAVKAAGFNAVRIPVTWGEHMNGNTIDADWMARVKEVVDYAYDCGLYVILNVHHDDYLWLTPTYANLESDKEKLTAIWQQISAEFADYDHHLLFEGMNEPRVVGSAEEWTGGTAESWDVINQLEAAFVETVRASSGKNTDRTLIVTSYAQSIEQSAVSAIQLPNDDHIVVSIHSYAPWNFCGSENSDNDWGTDADKAELDANFQYLDDMFVSKGIPVIIDEFGSVNKDNTSDRAAWYRYYISAAKSHGIKCFVWDNGIAYGDDPYALFNRNDCSWYFPEIIDAIMEAAS